MASPKGSKERIKTRCIEVYQVRVEEGLSYRELGRRFNISHQQVARDILRAINLINEPRTKEILLEREKENAKLDLIEKPLFEWLEDEDRDEPCLLIIDRILKLHKRRAELNGYDAPQKTALTNPDGDKETEVFKNDVVKELGNLSIDKRREIRRLLESDESEGEKPESCKS